MSRSFRASVVAGIVGSLLVILPAIAQETAEPVDMSETPGPTTTTRTDTADEDGMDLGWIGLLGLAGLAGLMRRDHHREHVNPNVTDRSVNR